MIRVFNIDSNNSNVLDREITKRPSFIKIFHPLCGHCIAMKPAWNKFVHNVKTNYKGDINIFNVQSNALATIINPALKSIKGYPTLIVLKKNGSSIEYNGNRSQSSLLAFSLKHLNLTNKSKSYKVKKNFKKSKSLKKNKYNKTKKNKENSLRISGV